MTDETAPLKLPRVINYYAGPGTGKSTTATAVFTEMKQLGINCEYVSEYAKDATWERRGWKVFAAQEYLFGKQHFRLARVTDEVDIVITDSPILLGLIYMPEGFGMPSLCATIKEAYGLYDNLDIFLERNKPYNPAGRNQTLEQAKALDENIKGVLHETSKNFVITPYGRKAIAQTIWDCGQRWGADVPELLDFMPSFKPVLTRKEKPLPFSKVMIEPPRGTSFQCAHLDAKGAWVGDVWGTTMQQYLGYEPRWWVDFVTSDAVMGPYV
jgi:hypothetical protein